ncbi:ABC transporter substrate-binding protein [Ornithinimicrobium panacihumi]|uniref:ABC transporter substrate-binding protein n=1 Tax=Ornithinimicrobium panacihumi TaxID=2008449 RepID=UPI003F89F7AC
MNRLTRATLSVTALSALVLAGCSVKDTDTGAQTSGTQTSGSETTTGSGDTGAATGGTDGSAATADAGSGDFPVTVDAENGEVTIDEQPERIVSLSPSATEILFAIGAGEQVVAADEWSTFPEEAPRTDLSGYDPNVEAIAGYDPDLVVIANDSNELVAALGELDIPVIVSGAPTELEGGYDAVALLGQATGQIDGTAEMVSTMRAEMDEAFAQAPKDSGLRIYHELDETFYSVSSNSFIGSVYEKMGAVNIADEADSEGTGYPQLTEEAIIAADPELIIVTDDASYTKEDVANRPGWSEITAVKNDNIVYVDADIASRWGPRLPQLVGLVADAMTQAHQGAPAGR